MNNFIAHMTIWGAQRERRGRGTISKKGAT
jgi:hypothetical protein